MKNIETENWILDKFQVVTKLLSLWRNKFSTVFNKKALKHV